MPFWRRAEFIQVTARFQKTLVFGKANEGVTTGTKKSANQPAQMIVVNDSGKSGCRLAIGSFKRTLADWAKTFLQDEKPPVFSEIKFSVTLQR